MTQRGTDAESAGFDDPRDSDVAQLWLELAGVPGDRGVPEAPAPAPSAPEAPESTPPEVAALLTRASDLPRPSAAVGEPVALPWSHEPLAEPSAKTRGESGRGSRSAKGSGRKRGTASATDTPEAEDTPDAPRVIGRGARDEDPDARPRRTRRPGPAPLPEDPREREEAAREVVLRQLALGPRSRGQLERKLTEREAEPELIERVLDRFEEVRLVDDAAFAEVWVRSRHRSRGLSRRAIGRELHEKGVDRDVAEVALEAIDTDDERAAALDLARRRARGRSVPAADSREGRAERDKVVRRLVGMLGRKGYAPGLAFSVVNEVLAELEE